MSYDPASRRQTPLARALAAEIARGGPLPLDRYMARCLWDEEHGYYATREPLGRAGDFITAPEISQTFGELVGLWAAVVWRDLMGAPSPVTLAELGPGRGTLMRDALRASVRVTGFHDSLRCHLVDRSPTLIALQRQSLADTSVPVSWSATAERMARPAIVIANEFFDAFPVRQWVSTAAGWAERGVGIDATGALAFCELSTPDVPSDLPTNAVLGDSAERVAMGDVFTHLGGGDGAPLAMLVIDYGHERSGLGDTLQAVRGHTHEHPLTSPGEADLSTQVDFEAVAAAARTAGLAVDGPVTQSEFLGRLGIVERASRLMNANPAKATDIELGVARLLAVPGMGDRFKVIGLRSPSLAPLPGLDTGTRETHRR